MFYRQEAKQVKTQAKQKRKLYQDLRELDSRYYIQMNHNLNIM